MTDSKVAETFRKRVFGSDKLTFAGVLAKYFDEESLCDPIRKEWQDSTAEGNIQDYNRRLLPNLPDNKAIEDFDDDDFENAVLGLRQSNQHYADATIQHYRWLFWKVYHAGLANGLYEDKLFWEATGKTGNPGKSEEELKARRELTRKSLSVPEELKLLSWFRNLSPEKANGEQMGLCLMFFLGLRNNEACGVNYGDLREISVSKPFYCLYITKTTSIGSSDLKVGGKTSNAARIIPVFDFLAAFIMTRKKFLTQAINDGTISASNADCLPIACKREDFLSRASSSDLSSSGRLLFRSLGISNQMRSASLHDTLFKQKLEAQRIDEKELTTYLFRRNFGTHLYHLGLSSGEIQYLIGHEIENAEEYRNFFTNEDNLMKIHQMMKAHPYIQFFENQKLEPFVLITCIGGAKSEFLGIDTRVKRFLILQNEPMDTIGIKQVSSNPARITLSIRDRFMPDGFSKRVDIRRMVNSTFYDTMNKEIRRNES